MMLTVNLVQAARFSPSRSNALARSAGARHRIPWAEGPRSPHAVVNRPKPRATHPEEILDDSVHRREPLSVAQYTCPRPPSPIVPVTEYGPERGAGREGDRRYTLPGALCAWPMRRIVERLIAITHPPRIASFHLSS